MPCPVCNLRKEKRFCPALHDRICAICCGQEREVTLDCPSDCPYLRQAREHERPRTPEELIAAGAELFPEVEVGQGFVYEREPLIAGLSFALARAARADREVRDRDLIAALTESAKTWQRRASSGLEYQAATNPVQQSISAELERMAAEYADAERKHMGYTTVRDSHVLRALVFLLRLAHSRSSGRPRSRAFVEFLLNQFPEKKESVIASASEGSRIIIP
ncbi:MAG TPA: hypothetical protein VFA60_06280 [Terriglobales bacterium]|nr:hypothetical protein [Terriglobales bacterium]